MIVEARLTPGDRVLDVGSGAGHSTLAFARTGVQTTGVDLTPRMVQTGRDLAEREGVHNVRFEQGDAERLRFERDAFDVVTCRLCAHHFADVPAALAEMRRVLRPGGRLLLVDSMAPENDAEDRFFQTFETLRDPSHVRNYRRSEWQAMLEGAGFACTWLDAWDLRIDFDDWIHRMHTPPAAVCELADLAARTPAPVRERFGFTGTSGVFLIPIAALRADDDAPGAGRS
jgi:SAM-dependent methyltransferase